MMKRSSWGAGRKLCSACLVLVPLAFAGPVEAKATLTILPAGTAAASINDSGVVVGSETPGLGFLRTPDGTITTFKAVDTAANTTPQSINSSGVMTGYYWQSDGLGHGFMRNADGAITTFDAPGANQIQFEGTVPTSINAKGVVTGSYYDQMQNRHGFVRAVDGTITTIDVPGAVVTEAMGVNDKGEIVGFWGGTVSHGFLRSANGKITSFDVPGDTLATYADGINTKGMISGYYVDQADVAHGYIRQPDGTFTTFDAGAGIETFPVAINAKGIVAGDDATNRHGRYQGFVRYQSGKMKAIKPANASGGTNTYGINKDGVVVGNFLVRTDRFHPPTSYGFLWTP